MKSYVAVFFILGFVVADMVSASRYSSPYKKSHYSSSHKKKTRISSPYNKERYSYDVPKTCAASFTQTNGEVVACVQGAMTGPSKHDRAYYNKFQKGLDRDSTPEYKGDCGALRILPLGGKCKEHEIRYVIAPSH